MLDKEILDPDKLTLTEFKLIKGQVDTPEYFDVNKIAGNDIENSLQFSFKLDDKLVKTDFTIELKTNSKGANAEEATSSFHLVFIFKVENIEQLTTKTEKNSSIKFSTSLGNALSSIVYSTSRGILLTRLQGTAFQNFILPIINPNKLLSKK